MYRRTRLLSPALAIGALLLVSVTATFAANGSASSFLREMIGRPGPDGMMSEHVHGRMTNGQGSAGMMSGSYSSGIMGGWTRTSGASTSISLDQARQNIQRYVEGFGNTNLAIDEIIEFQHNFYALIKDRSSGHGAMELLVNRRTGAVFPEFGPAMMWNTQYGVMRDGMGAMMGYQSPNGRMTVSSADAARIAGMWLARHQPAARMEAPDQLPGYYTIHFLQGGQMAGMLSVNGYTGQVWYHSWHGAALRVVEVTG